MSPPDPLFATTTHYVLLPDVGLTQQVSLTTILTEAIKQGLTQIDGSPLALSNSNYFLYIQTIDSLQDEARTKVIGGTAHNVKVLDTITVNRTGDTLTVQVNSPFITDTLPTLYSSIAALNTILAGNRVPACSLPQQALKKLMKWVLKFDGNGTHNSDLVLKNDTTRTLAVIHRQEPPQLQQMIAGKVSLITPQTKADEQDYAAMRANIKQSITQLENIREYIMKVNTVDIVSDPQLIELDTCIRNYLDSLKSSDELLSGIIKREEERKKRLSRYFPTLQVTRLTHSSTELTFKSGASFRIVPDFGFVGIFKGEGAGFQDMTPYLGFHINFRSIDKDIPFSQVRFKSWRHFLSFMAGLTLKSVAIQGKREDFFASNSLLTGLGVRVHNYLRLTGGMVWFKGVDRNPLSADKPLKFSPFAGLALDLELRELFQGISSLIK